MSHEGGVSIADSAIPFPVQSVLDCMVGYERYFKRRPEAAGSSATIEMPFVCDHCKHTRYSLEMIGGDGDLICSPCFESYVSALGG